ncbi:HlyD family secretion protein [Phenylobacterium sp. J426]|uniref:HlyD family secretion protein n=1 Tax=Phenylobacterium sp. J426 TaxID=2898439 RepID=UPI0021516319|nr:HlyD family secretion protein [Phenylobacterium sp. J426]MCR5875874.1 HlyD family secretion protein [Phenylobacterium sp. J426]
MQSTDNAYVSADSVVVAPKIAGYVERVFVTENQAVRKGRPLAELDPREYRAQAEQITSQIDAAAAAAETARSQIAEQQAAIAQAQAQLGAARAEAAFAGQQVARYQPLAASGAEPRERLAQLETQAHQARERVDAAQAALLAAQRRVNTLRAQVRQAQSQAAAARAQLAAARVTVESTSLRAAIDGRVGDLAVRVGQFVQPGTRLMTLVPVDRLFIEANFKETQLGLMRVGQPVSIEVDALPGVELTGRVASFAPGTGAQFSVLPPQNATGNFTKIVQRVPVRIAIEAPPEVRRLLVPGMSVEVIVDTRSAKGELERIRQAASRER